VRKDQTFAALSRIFLHNRDKIKLYEVQEINDRPALMLAEIKQWPKLNFIGITAERQSRWKGSIAAISPYLPTYDNAGQESF
jgi:hypothetical protein